MPPWSFSCAWESVQACPVPFRGFWTARCIQLGGVYLKLLCAKHSLTFVPLSQDSWHRNGNNIGFGLHGHFRGNKNLSKRRAEPIDCRWLLYVWNDHRCRTGDSVSHFTRDRGQNSGRNRMFFLGQDTKDYWSTNSTDRAKGAATGGCCWRDKDNGRLNSLAIKVTDTFSLWSKMKVL